MLDWVVLDPIMVRDVEGLRVLFQTKPWEQTNQ